MDFSDLPTPLTNVGCQGKSGSNSDIAKSTRLTTQLRTVRFPADRGFIDLQLVLTCIILAMLYCNIDGSRDAPAVMRQGAYRHDAVPIEH